MKLIVLLLSILFLSVSASANQNKKKSELLFPEEKSASGYWGKDAETIETSKDLKILEEISEEASTKKIEEARKYFNQSVSLFKNSEVQIQNKKKEFEKEVNLEDKFSWQKKAREVQRERELRKISIDARTSAITPLIKGMNSLEKIENPIVKTSPLYIDLKASLYREYIKHQYFLKNFSLTVDMIERYFDLSEKYDSEAEPHKILAVCLEKQEHQASKYKKDSLSVALRAKKNMHLLRFAELAYGKESNQYKKMEEKAVRE